MGGRDPRPEPLSEYGLAGVSLFPLREIDECLSGAGVILPMAASNETDLRI